MSAELMQFRRKLEPDRSFRVVIIYDDMVAGIEAMQTYQYLLSELGGEFDFCITLWRSDRLRSHLSMDGPLRDTIEADAIIVAIHQSGGLPDEIRDWVDAWVPRKRGQTALLIGLLDAGAEFDEDSGTRDCLETAAARAGIDFLARDIEPARYRTSLTAECHPNCRLAHEGWGLND
jgi:hypothetical protein